MSPNQELLNYITQARVHEVSDEQIVSNLQDVGWKIEDINSAFDYLLQHKTQGIIPSNWFRYFALSIDNAIVHILTLTLGFFVFSSTSLDPENIPLWLEILGLLVFLGITIGYNVYFLTKKGATPGKDTFGLTVVDYNSHTKLKQSQIYSREIAKVILSMIPIVNIINSLMVVFSKDALGIHDRVAGTQVLKVKKGWSIAKQLGCMVAVIIPFVLAICFAVLMIGLRGNGNYRQKKNTKSFPVPTISQHLAPTVLPTLPWVTRANNIKRRSDVNALLNAISQYRADNFNNPLTLPSIPSEIGNDAGQIDLCSIFIPKYLSNLPIDPSLSDSVVQDDTCAKPYHLGYKVRQYSGRIEVSAPLADNNEIIYVVR